MKLLTMKWFIVIGALTLAGCHKQYVYDDMHYGKANFDEAYTDCSLKAEMNYQMGGYYMTFLNQCMKGQGWMAREI